MATTTLIKTGINKSNHSYMLQTPSNTASLSMSSLQSTSPLAHRQRIDYTLADVYDDAAIIGSELEKIITNYGSDVIKDLMPKVISVLELLEDLTIRNEKENDEINELKMRINGLEAEKTQRINEREKFEKVIVINFLLRYYSCTS
jgi:hypothetical protein